jgi:FkbM family methyltransferase
MAPAPRGSLLLGGFACGVSDLSGARHASHERLRKARKLTRLLRTRRFRHALRHGVAAAIEHNDVPFESDVSTVIDVGAHHGQFALFAAERFPGAKIHCFEPLPAAKEHLERILAPALNAVVYPVAAASQGGSVDLHVSQLDDSSSLLPITERYTSAFVGTEEIGEARVDAARIDEILGPEDIVRPALLKIDVQGYELEVLRGAEGVIANVDEILLEVSFMEFYAGQPLAGELISYLHGSGFLLNGVFSLKRNRVGRCLQADLLFGRVPPTAG